MSLFLYMLGSIVVTIGRDEPIPASNGVILTRDIALVGLLLAEQGIAGTRENTVGNPFPFTKRLRRYLTDEQNAILESLPPLSPSIDSRHRQLRRARRGLPARAKRLAKATGARWPAEYEQAAVSHFEQSVGTRLAL